MRDVHNAANGPKRVIVPGDDGKPQRVLTQPPASSGSVEEETGVNVRATTGPDAATVDNERIDAAVARINRVIVRLEAWEYTKMQANHSPFISEQRLLREAVDLLNPEVKLA